ncbi:1-phosphofructokinase family hexose kinase [Brachybacterium huguangmaarense]
MIITLTANPSLDRTVTLGSALVPGGVHRIVEDTVQVGGKGINVAVGVARAGIGALAIAPAATGDPFRTLLEHAGVDHVASPVIGAVRTNLTVLSDGGVTTKINEPGAGLTPDEIDDLEQALLSRVSEGDIVMLSGSLAPGFPVDEYARLIPALRRRGAWVGIDTSDAPLAALSEAMPEAAPDFLKPNAEELGQLTGLDGASLEEAAARGEIAAVAEAARALLGRGLGSVLVTLGGSGAVLADAGGTWFAPAARGTRVVSTVGAGDSATAGYLIGLARGEDGASRLARAVAYGTAAVGLPGTTIPRPEQVDVDVASVRAL